MSSGDLQPRIIDMHREALDEMWRDTMLNQFHDVLPGTTISLVVEDVLAIHKRRSIQAQGLIEEALSVLYPGSRPITSISQISGDAVAIDPLRLSRENQLCHLDGGSVVIGTTMQGVGTVSRTATPGTFSAYHDGDDAHVVQNNDFRLTISSGRISSFVDRKLDRELIAPGPGAETGGLMTYEDYPLEWDAWDMEIYHLQNYTEISFDEVEIVQEPLWAGLRATARFGDSVATVTVSRASHETGRR